MKSYAGGAAAAASSAIGGSAGNVEGVASVGLGTTNAGLAAVQKHTGTSILKSR